MPDGSASPAALPTNDAASAATRLLGMGVDNYLLTSTVQALVGQRLVRTLCRDCRQVHEAAPDLVKRLGLDGLTPERPVRLWAAVGCPSCDGTDYRGRALRATRDG